MAPYAPLPAPPGSRTRPGTCEDLDAQHHAAVEAWEAWRAREDRRDEHGSRWTDPDEARGRWQDEIAQEAQALGLTVRAPSPSDGDGALLVDGARIEDPEDWEFMRRDIERGAR